MKCLPTTKLPTANGNVLHDWHAEILCLRAFNHFLLTECKAILTGSTTTSPYLSLKTPTPSVDAHHSTTHAPSFTWNPEVTLHLYCSEAPCGDASMELTIAAQPDAAPWDAPLSKRMLEKHTGRSVPAAGDDGITTAAPDLLLLGRACFSHLGVVRRKPARADAPPSLSKSCSDKLAAKQCTSLLSSVASLLVAPQGVYLSSLVLPESQYSAEGIERCFSAQGRMTRVGEGTWSGGYDFRPFKVSTTGLEFGFSRRGEQRAGFRFVASNLAIAWTASGLEESVIGGVLQGRKHADAKGGSAVCRKNIWTLARDIARLTALDETVLGHGSYQELKQTQFLASRRQVKQDIRADALKGWVRNVGDDDFGVAS